jgi:hypothetical protein
MRRAALLIVAVAGFTAVIGILVFVVRPAGGGTQEAVGVVIRVDSQGLTDVRGFTLHTNDGRELRFTLGRLENGDRFAPGHLVEHAATASPVRVTYHTEGDALIVTRLEDAS